MSSEVWNVGQTSANDTYELYKNMPFRSELFALNKITSICNDMITSFDEVIQDQNNYIVEFNDMELNFVEKQTSIQEEIKRLLAEVKALEEKDADGTITENEARELATKKETLNGLYSSYSDQRNADVLKMETKKSAIKEKYSQKEKIASDYGHLAIEKGNTFIDQELKEKIEKKESINAFKFIGKFKSHFAGTAAVAAGDTLLNKVDESSLIDKNLSSKKIK